MKTHRSGLLAAPFLAAALASAAPITAQAQSMASGWQFEATVYGWFPAIGGTTSFPPTGNGPSIDLSTRDVIDALKFAFMGSFEARNGQWGLWTDLVYGNFGGSHQTTLQVTPPGTALTVPVDAYAKLDVKSWIWTLAGQYNLRADAEGNTDLLFGVRMIDMTNTLNWSVATDIPQLPGRSGMAEASLTNWDAVVGIKGKARLGEERKWFIPYYLDVGTGQSKLTWQIQAGLGYQFGWGAVLATWRYLDYDFKDSSGFQTLTMNGPTIGVAFNFGSSGEFVGGFRPS